MTADVPIDHNAKGKSITDSVQEDWDGGIELESDDDDARREVVEEGNLDESGRYDIQERGPTRSERTNGAGRFDPLTTYTTDEEDLSEDELEDQAYDTAGSDDDDMRKGRMDRRRSYWLSKAIGSHDRDDEDGVVFAS